jgi:hypothetical protein
MIHFNKSPCQCDSLAHLHLFLCSTALVAPGPGSVVGSAVDAGLESVAAGFSLTNAFEVSILFYNGFGLFEYGVACTYFDAVTIGLDSERLGLPAFLSISATITRGLAITAPSGGDIEAAFASFDGDDILTALTEFNVQALVKGELKGALLLSEIPNIGIVFPDLNLASFETNALISIGKTPLDFEVEVEGTKSTQKAYPGLSVFAGTSGVAGFIQGIAEFIITVAGSLLDLLPSWIPIDIDAAAIAEELDFTSVESSDVFGAGFTANSARTGFIFNMPLLISEIGTIQVNCYTDYDTFNCATKVDVTDLGEEIAEFFTGAAEDVKDGVLWVVRKTDEAFTEAGAVVATAFEGATEELSKAFSKENLSETASQLADGLIDITGTTLDEAERAAVIAYTNLILNPAKDLTKFVEDGVKDVSQFGKDAVDGAEDTYNDAKDSFEGAAADIESTLDCAVNSIVNGNNGCSPFGNIVDFLSIAGDDAEKVLEDAANAILSFLAIAKRNLEAGFLGKYASSLYTISQKFVPTNPEQRDSTYNCKSRRPDQRAAL